MEAKNYLSRQTNWVVSQAPAYEKRQLHPVNTSIDTGKTGVISHTKAQLQHKCAKPESVFILQIWISKNLTLHWRTYTLT